MPRRRADLSVVELQSNESNTRRALQRNARLLDRTESDERIVAKLDGLIDATIRECAQGATVGPKRKRNPAFENLRVLIKSREMLLANRKQALPDHRAKKEAKSPDSFSQFNVSPMPEMPR